MPTAQEWIRDLEAGALDAAFAKLYAPEPAVLSAQRKRYRETIEAFEDRFGAGRELHIYSAPGRTEIGGNHTDHNNGVVLAASVNLDIIAVVAKNDSDIVRVKSKGFDKIDIIDLKLLTPQEVENSRSASLVRGVAAAIADRGGRIGGFDAFTTSDVLRGSGLSSSAAFEVVIGAIFRGEYNGNSQELLSQVELAKIGQYAENVFFGKPSGLMDQTACAVGGAISIDFRDPAAPVVTQASLDLAAHGYALCISDTKGSHADLTPDYAAVRGEMEQVAACFGKKVLREVEESAFWASLSTLREKTGDRALLRAIHFFADTRRAEALCKAIQQDRFSDFLALIREGGHSSFEYNQNAYSIREPAQQGVPLGLAVSQHVLGDRGAYRLQGGGFAGTIQAFVPLELVQDYRQAIDAVFGPGSCHVLSIRAQGAVAVTAAL